MWIPVESLHEVEPQCPNTIEAQKGKANLDFAMPKYFLVSCDAGTINLQGRLSSRERKFLENQPKNVFFPLVNEGHRKHYDFQHQMKVARALKHYDFQ